MVFYLKFSLVILLLKLLDVNSEELFGDHEHSKQLLDHLSESEQLFLFGANPHEATFEIAHLNHHKRRKRSLSYDDQDLVGLKKHLHVKQTPRSLLDPQFLLLRRRANATEAVEHNDDIDSCYYRSEHAALFACDDIRGVIKSNDSFYYIHPLPERFHIDNSKPHVIVKRNPNPTDERTCIQRDERDIIHEKPLTAKHWSKHRRKRHAEISRPNIEEFKLNIAHRNKTINSFIEKLGISNVRQKRGILPAIFVETAVFVDRDLYKHMTTNFPKDTERELVRFVLAMINAVQLLYHDSSLGRPVNFILKRLEILHEDPANLKRPHDIDRFLSNFCTWQRLENPPGDNDPLHWDHALILTGLDLYVVNKNGKVSSQVVGLAPVAGMCTVTSSCTVNEGRHFESVYVVAHEIGHNLGMRHDGPLADNGCDPSAYIMSPTLGSGKITWSQCSKSYLQKFLDTVQSRCLLDHGNSAGQLDHSAEGILPGERFDADQQCMLKYGRGSRHSGSQSLEDICRDLHCQRERYTWTSHPALEGTKCGEDMYCRGGECVERLGIGISSRGGRGAWARWGVWSECASACLLDDTLAPAAAGVAVATRRCTRARNSNGNYCTGHDKKYQSCHAQQCNNVPRMTVREFADEICSRARDVDPDLIGTGLQRIDSDDVSSACAVWCDTRGGGYKSRGWTLPDGTACSRTSPMFCISGICQKFTCSSNPDAEFSLKPADCEWEALQLQTATPHATSTKSSWRRAVGSQWRPTSGCHYHCISPGVGVRLVRSSSKSLTSIQLCHPDSSRHDLGCTQRKSPYQYATMVCSKYKERVRRLSGLGMQISPVLEDPDRPCRIACQDERVPHRFYLVNGQEGWFPLGTSCGKKNASFCVSGKCLEFGPDNTPLSESVFTLPLLGRYSSSRSSRHRRSLRYSNLRNVTLRSDTLRNKTNLRSNMTSLRSNTNSQRINTTTVQSNMTSPQSIPTSLKSNATNLQSNMTSQRSNLSSPQSNPIRLKSNTTTLQSNMTSLRSNTNSQRSNLSNPQSNPTSLKSITTNLQSDTNSQRSNTTDLRSNPTSQRSNTNTLQSNVTSLQNNTNSQRSILSSPQGNPTSQRSNPTSLKSNTANLQGDMTNLRSYTNSQRSNLSSPQSNQTSLKCNTANQSDMTSLRSNTTDLRSNPTSQQTNPTSFRSDSESLSNSSIRKTDISNVTSQRSERSLRRDAMPVKATLHPHTLNEIIAELNLTHNVNDHIHFDTIPENIEVDFNNPIHIAPEDTFMQKHPRPTWD